jgi:hypothetical protein
MFELNGQGGVFDSWVERWRSLRGISDWPIVAATVCEKERNDDPEGGISFQLTLTYKVPAPTENDSLFATIKLTTHDGTPPSVAGVGDIVQLRVHPTRPGSAVFADTSNAATDLMVLALITAIFASALFYYVVRIFHF